MPVTLQMDDVSVSRRAVLLSSIGNEEEEEGDDGDADD